VTKPHCGVIEQKTSGRMTHGTRSDAKQKTRDRLRLCTLFLLMYALCWQFDRACSLSAGSEPANTARDGQHDFDFEIGTWKSHISRRVHPLSGSTTWVEMEATVVVRKVWNGRANLMELEADTPTAHLEELNLRLYNPQSQRWSFNFATSNDGTIAPPMIGEFKNGRGEFIDYEPFNGKTILVRHLLTDIRPDSHHFEQSFSADGGRTWEPNFVATLTREKD